MCGELDKVCFGEDGEMSGVLVFEGEGIDGINESLEDLVGMVGGCEVLFVCDVFFVFFLLNLKRFCFLVLVFFMVCFLDIFVLGVVLFCLSLLVMMLVLIFNVDNILLMSIVIIGICLWIWKDD